MDLVLPNTSRKTALQFKAFLLGRGIDRTLVDFWIPPIFDNNAPLKMYMKMMDSHNCNLDFAERQYLYQAIGDFMLMSTPSDIWGMEKSQ